MKPYDGTKDRNLFGFYTRRRTRIMAKAGLITKKGAFVYKRPHDRNLSAISYFTNSNRSDTFKKDLQNSRIATEPKKITSNELKAVFAMYKAEAE